VREAVRNVLRGIRLDRRESSRREGSMKAPIQLSSPLASLLQFRFENDLLLVLLLQFHARLFGAAAQTRLLL